MSEKERACLLFASRSAIDEDVSRGMEHRTVTPFSLRLFGQTDGYREGASVALAMASSLLDTDLALHADGAGINASLERTLRRMRETGVPGLAALSSMKDPAIRGVLGILATSLPAFYRTSRTLHDSVCSMMAELSLRHGNSEDSPHAYAMFAAVIGRRLGRWDEAREIAELVRGMVARPAFARGRAAALYALAEFVECWIRPMEDVQGAFDQASQAGAECADFVHAAFAAQGMLDCAWAKGDPPARTAALARALLSSLPRFGGEPLLAQQEHRVRSVLRLATALHDEGSGLEGRWTDADPRSRAWALYMGEDFAGAVAALHEADEAAVMGIGRFGEADFRLIETLAMAAHFARSPSDWRPGARHAVQQHARRFTQWAQDCPSSFDACAALVNGCLAEVEGRDAEASDLYVVASQASRQRGLTHLEAMAHEAGARLSLRAGDRQGAAEGLRRARGVFARWGACGKVNLIERRHSALLAAAGHDRRQGASVQLADLGNGNFISMIGHELRTPLNVILGYSGLIERSASLSAQESQGMRSIRKSGEQLVTLIDDLLDLARMAAGKLQLCAGSASLRGCLRDVVEQVRHRADAKGLRLVVQLPPDLPKAVRVDERRLQQVLVNMLAHAIDVSPSGEVFMQVRLLASQPLEVRLAFEVSDGSEQPVKQGAERGGLALALTTHLARYMGGDIGMAQQDGHGNVSSFEIVMPINDMHGQGLG